MHNYLGHVFAVCKCPVHHIENWPAQSIYTCKHSTHQCPQQWQLDMWHTVQQMKHKQTDRDRWQHCFISFYC